MATDDDIRNLYVAELKNIRQEIQHVASYLLATRPLVSGREVQNSLSRARGLIAKHSYLLTGVAAAQSETLFDGRAEDMLSVTKEAIAQVTGDAAGRGPLLDIAILTRYIRLSRFSFTSFDIAAIYADALGRSNDVEMLRQASEELYISTECLAELRQSCDALKAHAAA